MSEKTLQCFKKYDIRGVVDTELTEEIAFRVGRGLAVSQNADTAVIGCDNRLSSPKFKQAIIDGLVVQGTKVFDIGQTGTEEMYFACQQLNASVGIEVTASHNPIEYNGIKFVAKAARPLSNSEFELLRELVSENKFVAAETPGEHSEYLHLPEYTQHLLSYLHQDKIKPLRIVTNAGNGMAGHVIDALEILFSEHQLPVEFIKIFHNPDGTFPGGIPNPLLPEDRWKTSQAVIEHGADMGIAWDGDFDRCFLFDESGRFIEGIYIVALLAKAFLLEKPGSKIVHDPRLYWCTEDVAESNRGNLVRSLTGHAFIKETMRQNDAIYGGEMSAHHYFKSFGYCDSGMIPWLLIINLLSSSEASLSKMVAELQHRFPTSGEINFTVESVDSIFKQILHRYKDDATQFDWFDGLSMEFADWRFNLRASATEPLLRLNVESRNDKTLVDIKVTELRAIIENS